MKIQPNNYTYQNTTNFKSVYPVVHWVCEANGSYAPIANLNLAKKLQGKIVRILNKPLNDTKKNIKPEEQKLRAYIGSSDIDYRNVSVVRSFYNRIKGSINKYTPVSYLISGDDVKVVNEYLTKHIGRAKEGKQDLISKPYSPELAEAIRHYNIDGLKFVQDKDKQLTDEAGFTYILHTKFEIIRNKLGQIKDYKFQDARFLPSEGTKNPLERI